MRIAALVEVSKADADSVGWTTAVAHSSAKVDRYVACADSARWKLAEQLGDVDPTADVNPAGGARRDSFWE
jgi:hypothetical protein